MVSGKAEIHFLIAPKCMPYAIFFKSLMDCFKPFDRFKCICTIDNAIFAAIQWNSVSLGRIDSFLKKFVKEFRPHRFTFGTQKVFSHITENFGFFSEKVHVVGERDIPIIIQSVHPISLLMRKEQRFI